MKTRMHYKKISSKPVGNVLQSQQTGLATAINMNDLQAKICTCEGDCPRCLPVQAKLQVGQANDRYEQEADKIANHAIGDEKSKSINNPSIDYSSQDQNMPQPSTSQSIYTQLETTKGKGQALSPALRQQFEPKFYADFSNVKLHHNDSAHQLCQQLNAKAFTYGADIYFNKGEYQTNHTSGRRLLAHELTHTLQQGAITSKAGHLVIQCCNKPRIQRTKANLYVYDSTQGGALGLAWRKGAWLWAKLASGGYAVASGRSIVTMLRRMLRRFIGSGCSCIEEIQFWGHGEQGRSMDLSAVNGQRLDAADFNVPGIQRFRQRPNVYSLIVKHGARRALRILQNTQAAYIAWKKSITSVRQRLLVELRERICPSGAEIYYRSCETFQGRTGKAFASAAANFWRSKVIGHTYVIGLSQPGKKTLKPGQRPSWSDAEGTGAGSKNKHWLKSILKGKTIKKLFKRFIPFL